MAPLKGLKPALTHLFGRLGAAETSSKHTTLTLSSPFKLIMQTAAQTVAHMGALKKHQP